MEVCNERNCMHRSMCMLGKLYWWTITASKKNKNVVMIEVYWSKLCLYFTIITPSSMPPGTKSGPGQALIWQIFGFVKSKIDGENAVFWTKKWCDLQKKRKKKKVFRLHMLISQCHFDGPAEANGLPEAHGPIKAHGPRGHCTPLPPLLAALPVSIDNTQNYILRHCLPDYPGKQPEFC